MIIKNKLHFKQLVLSGKLSKRHDYSHITDMNYLFHNCHYLTKVPKLDLSNVTTLRGMFSGCVNIKTLPSLNISSKANTTWMLNGCKNLESLDVKDFINYDWKGASNKPPKIIENCPELFI